MSQKSNKNNCLQELEQGGKLSKHIRIAAKKYGGWADDVAQECLKIVVKRGYFHSKMIDEAARNVGVFKTTYSKKYTILLPPPKSKKACKNKEIETKSKRLDERLVLILRDAVDPRVQAVIKNVLAGCDVVEACEKNKMSYRTFVENCRETMVQPPLFGFGMGMGVVA